MNDDRLDAESERVLQSAGRAALGVVGRWEYGGIREALRLSGLHFYPLVAVGLLGTSLGLVLTGSTFVDPSVRGSLGRGLGDIALGGLFVSAIAAFGALVALRRGWARPRLALVGGSACALGLAAAAMFPMGGGLLALLAPAAIGVASAVHLPLLTDHYRPEVRVRVLCAYTAALAAGLSLSAFLPAVAGGAGLTWRAAMAAMAVVAAAVTVLAARLVDASVGRWDRGAVAAAVRARLGHTASAGTHEGPATADIATGEMEKLRRASAPRAARPLLLLVAMVGVLVGPVQSLTLVLLRDRWELTAGSRLLAAALMFAATVPGLAWVARRGELLFRNRPAHLAHFGAWLGATAAIALALGAVIPILPLAIGLLAVAWTGLLAVIPIAAMLLFSITSPELRSHASVLLWLSILAGSALGGIYTASFGSRFGVGWAMVAAAALVLLAAARLTRAIAVVDDDTNDAAARLVEREVLSTQRSRGQHLPLLTCRRISFSYGQLQVLFDVDFTVDDGEMVALLGTNGAGKSTLLRVISGLGVPSRGSVRFRGSDITYIDTDKRVRLGISQIPGGKAVFGPMSVVDNLTAFGFSHGRNRAAVDQGIEATFDAFPRLAERRNQLASTLSGGEQQMLALGKAFILRPRVLLIDELSLGLAPKIVGELLTMVERINADGTAVVLVEQSVNIALALVDHAYFMEKGEIRFDGRADELIERPDLLRSVFLAGVEKGLLEAGGSRS